MLMLRSCFALAAIGCALCGQVAAQQADVCKNEMAATNSAAKIRDRGKPKEELLSILPPRKEAELASEAEGKPTLALIMYSIADELYEHPEISGFSYFVYRSYSCITRAEGKYSPPALSVVAEGIVACQSTHGADRSDALLGCIGKVIQKHASKI